MYDREMPVKHITVQEAHALQAQGAIYVDVRSSPEFAAGHPAGAVNVPLLEPDEETGQMMPNPDFLRVVKANYPADTKLLVGCQMGGRSMRAAQMLEAFGFADVSNVRGGYGGAHDPMSGRAVDPGWAESGFPVEQGATAGTAYADLVAKADRGGA
jgi:rhodanese-related sulfurtransferase